MSRHRAWAFTLNNYTDKDEARLAALPEWVAYCVYGRETAPQTGTKHLQGYVQLHSPSGFKRVITYVGKSSHIEPAKGNFEQNYKYCTKGEDFVEIGKPIATTQGKRSDIAAVKQMVLDGASMVEIIMVSTSYQSIRAAEKLKQYLEPVRDWNPQIIWIYGPSGYGKSHLARELAPGAFYTSESYKFWQGYDAHEDVIIDNFTPDWAPLVYMLRLLDKYPFTVEYKGGARQFLARRIIITTVRHPNECYNANDEFRRRIAQYGKVIELARPWQERQPGVPVLPEGVKGKERVKPRFVEIDEIPEEFKSEDEMIETEEGEED